VELDSHRRFLQAVHFAAGIGNVGALRVLIEARADPDAAALLDGQCHYMPIHDAAWFNRQDSMDCLLENGASLKAKNNEGDTALHISAKLGYVQLVRSILAKQRGRSFPGRDLIGQSNKRGATPFELAVERGQFPTDGLTLFTDHMDQEAKLKAFQQVAHGWPDAAAVLLQGKDTNATGIDKMWKQSLQYGAEVTKSIKVVDLARLIESTPLAAMLLIDALTDVPKVKDGQHNPLPIRALLSQDSDPVSIGVEYQEGTIWQWTPKRYPGHEVWHHRIAPPDLQRGREVKIKVLRMQGVVDVEVLGCLAAVTDLRLFTKLVIHALLKFAWSTFKKPFIVDYVHEFCAVTVISIWIWGSFVKDSLPPIIPLLMWCVVASQGVAQCAMPVINGSNCWWIYSRLQGEDNSEDGKLRRRRRRKRRLFQLLFRNWHHAVIGATTTSLAVSCQWEVGFWPGNDARVNALLAANSLLHGVNLLYQLRAFQWTGQRLLPIMKSVEPIAGMLVIMSTLCVSFLHAFWAIEREMGQGFGVMVFLFTGESFVDEAELPELTYERSLTIILVLLAAFFFLTCALNVFIAVLSDCYDAEQERMVGTFMKERAKLCVDQFLRPGTDAWPWLLKLLILEWPFAALRVVQSFECGSLSQRSWNIFVLALPILAHLLFSAGLLYAVLEIPIRHTQWLVVLFWTASLFVCQGHLRSRLTEGWEQRYLWLCHEANVEEEMLFAPDTSNVKAYGRLSTIKQYIFESTKSIVGECSSQIREVREDFEDFRKEVHHLHHLCKETSHALTKVAESLKDGDDLRRHRVASGCLPPDEDEGAGVAMIRRAVRKAV